MSRNDTVIDRFEDGKAVCYTGEKQVLVDASLLPASACEGDVIVKKGASYVVDDARTRVRRNEADALLKSILKE